MHASPPAPALADLSAKEVTWLNHATDPPTCLTLRRAWPKSQDHMLAEFNSPNGTIIAGQWFADAARGTHVLNRLRATFPSARLGYALVQNGLLTLQGDGADDKMPTLAAWVARSNTTLLVHRPTRRAVLRTLFDGQTAYAKLVPPKSAASLLESALRVQHIQGVGFAVPRLLHTQHSHDTGCVVWSELPGRSVHALLETPAFTEAARGTGRALRALHDHPPVPGVPEFGAMASTDELTRWVDRTSAFDRPLADLVQARSQHARSRLHPAPHSQHTLIHRDFHDKQVFITDDGHAGLLDFDTLSTGEPALDVGNFLAHLELRCAQGRLTPQSAEQASVAFITAYAPCGDVYRRSLIYRSMTLLRLCCVYAFRTGGSVVARALLDAADCE